ncbi:MAG: hypothetical protein NT145_07875 [Elusimicrobia bacterium]|nr:hypothetical protein [Elusimicrobiota bacterium]
MKKIVLFLCLFLLASASLAEAKKKGGYPLKDVDLNFQKHLDENRATLGNIPEIIKGGWINKSTGTEFEEKIAEFEKINSIAADVFCGSIISSKEHQKKGTILVHEDLWKDLSKEEKKFGFEMLRFFEKQKRLPNFYNASLKNIIAKYEADKSKSNSEIIEASSATFAFASSEYDSAMRSIPSYVKPNYSYLLLAMQYTCNGEKEKAREMIAGLAETDLNNFPPNKIIEYINEGDYFVKDYNEVKLNSENLKGCKTMFTITVTEILAEPGSNVIAGIVGKYSNQPYLDTYPGPMNGQMRNAFEEAILSENSKRILVQVPKELTNQITYFNKGTVIKVKGKVLGLRLWSDYFGYVPLIELTELE